MRRHQDEIGGLGARIVAVGTGNRDFAAAFVRDEKIEFPVLVDEEGEAAKAVELASSSMAGLLKPSVLVGQARALSAGHKQKRSGPRVMQLGATFVIAPGDRLLYEHRDSDVANHAPIEEVLAALSS